MVIEDKFSFTISVSELREIMSLLVDRLEEAEGRHIQLPEDYYWNIPAEEKYNVLESPANLNIGQLTEDWDELRKLLIKEDRDGLLQHNLSHLASIIRAIAEFAKD